MPASKPKKEFSAPAVLEKPAPCPKKEFFAPVLLRRPASKPTKALLLPGALKKRLPPMLYWVEVLMLPATSSNDCGLFVPIPTLPDDFMRIRSVAADNPLVANRMSLAVCVQITVST